MDYASPSAPARLLVRNAYPCVCLQVLIAGDDNYQDSPDNCCSQCATTTVSWAAVLACTCVAQARNNHLRCTA